MTKSICCAGQNFTGNPYAIRKEYLSMGVTWILRTNNHFGIRKLAYNTFPFILQRLLFPGVSVFTKPGQIRWQNSKRV